MSVENKFTRREIIRGLIGSAVMTAGIAHGADTLFKHTEKYDEAIVKVNYRGIYPQSPAKLDEAKKILKKPTVGNIRDTKYIESQRIARKWARKTTQDQALYNRKLQEQLSANGASSYVIRFTFIDLPAIPIGAAITIASALNLKDNLQTDPEDQRLIDL
jgi:hypothetical protein